MGNREVLGMKLGQLIQEYRTEHRYSLREFADICGISFAQVRLMERGLNSKGNPFIPSVSSLKAVAKGMGISLSTLLENCDDMEIRWDEEDVAISKEKQELIDRVLRMDAGQLSKLSRLLDIVEER